MLAHACTESASNAPRVHALRAQAMLAHACTESASNAPRAPALNPGPQSTHSCAQLLRHAARSLHSLVLVVDAQAAPDVQVLQLEALRVDALQHIAHDDGSVPAGMRIACGGQ